MLYGKWWGEKLWTVVPAGAVTAQYLETFKDYPYSQTGGTSGVEQILQKIKARCRLKGLHLTAGYGVPRLHLQADLRYRPGSAAGRILPRGPGPKI